MEKKRIVPVWLSIALVILAAAEIVLEIYHIFSADSLSGGIQYFFFGLCALMALLYCSFGYQKRAATYFLGFCAAATVTKAISLVNAIIYAEESPVAYTVMWVIEFICLAVLALGKNLGKNRSYGLAIAALVCEISVTSSLSMYGVPFGMILTSLGQVVNAVVLGIMVYAKYQDKAARGRI